MPTEYADKGADVSGCGYYRYALWRVWDDKLPRAVFVMLNPSKADGEADDPTIRRCVGFAKSWQLGGLHVVNLFAYRATDPDDLFSITPSQRVGPLNDEYLRLTFNAARQSGHTLVCAWGDFGQPQVLERTRFVRLLAADRGVTLNVLKLTKNGRPNHPVRLPGALSPVPWFVPEVKTDGVQPQPDPAQDPRGGAGAGPA